MTARFATLFARSDRIVGRGVTSSSELSSELSSEDESTRLRFPSATFEVEGWDFEGGRTTGTEERPMYLPVRARASQRYSSL